MIHIPYALISQGIVKGIREGENIPEKPLWSDYKQVTPLNEHVYRQNFQQKEDDYNRALSSLGTEFEDQDTALLLIVDSIIDSGVKGKVKELNVYPISVEVDEVWQRKTDDGWVPSVKQTHELYQRNNLPLSRHVLRIVGKKEPERVGIATHITGFAQTVGEPAVKDSLTPFGESLKLLRDLADLQNGPPLETTRNQFEETIKEVCDFLNKHES